MSIINKMFDMRLNVVFNSLHRSTTRNEPETTMSRFASDLIELSRMPRNDDGKLGGLVELLLREIASNLIAAGVADFRGGC